MTASQIVEIITHRKTALLYLSPDEHIKGTPWEYQTRNFTEEDDITADQQATGNQTTNEGWVILDLFTASAMLALYNALSETARTKFNQVHITKLADIAWKSMG